jgi:hypothetical protein
MKKLSRDLLIAGATAAMFAASASAQLMVQGVGSSAQFQAATVAAFGLAGAGAGYYVTKNSGNIIDHRGDANIVPQLGNLSIVWNSAGTQAWTYLSVDSVVGNRAYFSVPRATLSPVSPLPALPATPVIPAAYFGGVAATPPASIPASVISLITGAAFTAAFTDILPADAKFAQNRVNCGTGTTATLGCLGYGTSDANVGAQIQGVFSTSQAQPVNFNIYGTDPITGSAIPNYTVVPVGIEPIIIIDNRTDASGLGQTSLFSDITYQATAQLLWTGTDCSGTAWGPFDAAHNFAVNPIQREPMSGTMNTFEFNFMVQNQQGSTANGYFSQESIFNSPYFVPTTFGAIQPATNNPLNGACPGGSPYASSAQGARKRALSTGDVVSGVKSTADAIGYIFFGYGNVASISASTSYGYLTYQTVDPINPSGSYTTPFVSGGLNYPGNGQLPVCTAPCPIAVNTSFPNVRNGAYKQWSLLRAVADAGSTALANLTTLANAEANEVNGTQPDFLPFNATTDGDSGFIGYRIHFSPGMTGTPTFSYNATNTPNNGITTPTAEAGGDVGGCLDYKTDPNQLNCRY